MRISPNCECSLWDRRTHRRTKIVKKYVTSYLRLRHHSEKISDAGQTFALDIYVSPAVRSTRSHPSASPLDVNPSSSLPGLPNGTGAMRHPEIITPPSIDTYINPNPLKKRT